MAPQRGYIVKQTKQPISTYRAMSYFLEHLKSLTLEKDLIRSGFFPLKYASELLDKISDGSYE